MTSDGNSQSNPQSARAYSEILRMILGHELRPGQALAVPDLAEKMSMSVTPVRDAIRKLEAEGLLQVVPRRGTFVRSFELSDLIVGYEAAEAAEGMAAYLVAERVRDGSLALSELDVLERLVTRMRGLLGESDIHSWSEADSLFHGTIVNLGGNKILQMNWWNIKTQMDCVLWFITPLYVDRNNSTNEHSRIVAALKAGDHDLARSLSQKHKNRVRNTLCKLVAGGRPRAGDPDPFGDFAGQFEPAKGGLS